MYTFPKKTHAQFNFCEYNKFHSIIIIKRADDSRGGVGYSYEVWLISLSLHLVLVSFLRINKIHMTLNFYKFPPMCYFLQGMINIMKMWNVEELKNLLYNICLAVFDFFYFCLIEILQMKSSAHAQRILLSTGWVAQPQQSANMLILKLIDCFPWCTWILIPTDKCTKIKLSSMNNVHHCAVFTCCRHFQWSLAFFSWSVS